MWRMITSDILDTLVYIPAALAAGVLVCLLLLIVVRAAHVNGPSVFTLLKVFVLAAYLLFLFCLVLLSRPAGSRTGVNLIPLGTLGENALFWSYFIENILLFIPLGMLLPSILKVYRRLLPCLLTGCFVSLAIEILQFITQRGYAQLDDVLTNTLGAGIGYLLFRAAAGLWHGFRKK